MRGSKYKTFIGARSMMQRDESLATATNWFYGPPPKRPKGVASLRDRVEKALEGGKLVDARELHPFRGGLSDGADVLYVFSRQRDAYAYRTKQNDPLLRIFSFETNADPGGKRSYMVCRSERFWHDYELCKQPHFYELILEGWPSRLYFDLEFYRDANVELDGDRCLAEFISCVCHQLHKCYGLVVTRNAFLDLDSSTGAKFSRHLIAHLPNNAVFINNVIMGRFVEKLCDYLTSKGKALVLNRDGKAVPLCDRAVYTRNRNFRLFLSSKATQQNPLVLAKECSFYHGRLGNGTSPPSNKRIFDDSLIVCFASGPLLNSPESAIFVKVENSSDSNVSPSADSAASSFLPAAGPAFPSSSAVTSLRSEPTNSGFNKSPFPSLDEYIVEMLKKYRANTFIRSWRLFGEGPTERIVYEIGGCRYCFNIEREHRGNHVYWVVDLCNRVAYQKCHDPECHGFRSNDFPLPPFVHTNPAPSPPPPPLTIKTEFPDDSVTDEELLQHIERWEKENGHF
uniref:DNA-directed primase/polymerase protein n=1 Tax=Plectus sambesii TaxID=2011161 RepID=A0A914W3G3_9BILA